MRYFIFILSLTVSLYSFSNIAEKRILKLMGSRFEITAIAQSKQQALDAIDAGIAEISRIENLISEWDLKSQTSAINRNAGIDSVSVDIELFNLIRRSIKISQLTNGAFDISFEGIYKLYTFDRGEHPLPDSAIVAKSVKLINWENIKLNPNNHKVYLTEKGMKIGFGSNGKGYAANRAMKLMKSMPGVVGGIVNASGDMMVWGESNHPDGWNIQIANPQDKNKPIAWLKLNNQSIVTSGDYEKYFTSKGIRYSHIINPKTGYPVTEVKSATIISPDAELSDALATSMCVLGIEKGLKLAESLKDVACILVDKDNKIYSTKKLKLNYIH